MSKRQSEGPTGQEPDKKKMKRTGTMVVTAEEAADEDLLLPVVLNTPGTTTRAQVEEIKKENRREKRLHARARTMAETAREAAAFLKHETGNQEFLHNVVKSNAPETRGRTAARHLISDMLTDTADEEKLSEKAKRSSLHMVFHLFDHDGSGQVTEEELAGIFRSLGKRPMKKKIRAIMAELDPEKTGKISEEAFVEHLMQRHKEKAAKRKAEEAKEAEEKKEKEEEKEEKKEEKKEKKKLTRKLSLFDYYSSAAGISFVGANAHSGAEAAKGSMFDLGVDGAFSDFTILIYAGSLKPEVHGTLTAIAESKGFKTSVVTDLRNFLRELPSCDEAWIFSGSHDGSKDSPTQDWSSANREALARCVSEFHDTGRGLGIFATGHGDACEANVVLQKLFSAELTRTVEVDSNGSLINHQLTSGLTSINAGTSHVFTAGDDDLGLTHVAENSKGQPTILVKDFGSPFETANGPTGRVLVDLSASRFFAGDDNVARFGSNAAVWLHGVDYRIANSYNTSGRLQAEDADAEYIWQYRHGGWYNYEGAGSKIVEKAYQEYLKNPSKNVQSGYWKYMIDFINMKQTNIDHHAHTKRDIRRVPAYMGVE